jgi:hypothetical protein
MGPPQAAEVAFYGAVLLDVFVKSRKMVFFEN